MYTTADVLKFLIKTLGGWAPYASLVHLAFLAQYDVRGREVRKYLADWQPLARADFYLRARADSYRQEGVFSFEIADAAKEFDAKVVQIYPSLVYDGPAPSLPPPVERRLAYVAILYGDWKPWQLRRHIYEILDLSIPEKRGDYSGHLIEDYLHIEGFKIAEKELLTDYRDFPTGMSSQG
jgi:hypothetical protein